MHVLTCPDVLQLFSPMWVKTINISIHGNFCLSAKDRYTNKLIDYINY